MCRLARVPFLWSISQYHLDYTVIIPRLLNHLDVAHGRHYGYRILAQSEYISPDCH